MLPPLPRCSGWACSSLPSPSRVSLPRFHFRVGLHIVLFEVCSAFTHVAACTLARSPKSCPLSGGFRHFVASMPAPVASGWSDLAGWGLHPLESAAFSRRTWKTAICLSLAPRCACCRSGDEIEFALVSWLLFEHAKPGLLELGASHRASEIDEQGGSVRVLRGGRGQTDGIDNGGICFRWNGPNDPDTGFDRGIRGVDDTERSFAARDQQQRNPHILAGGTAA